MDGNEKALHNRDAFQLERLILFTDAVFAIAITLLVIELKVPELEHRTEHEALNALARLVPKFIGFLISFFIIAIYWTAHHRIFRFVRHLDARLIWLNLLFLLSIVAHALHHGLPERIRHAGHALGGVQPQHHRHRPAPEPHPNVPAAPRVRHRERARAPPPRPRLGAPPDDPLVFAVSIGLAFFVHPWVLRLVPGVVFPLLGIYFGRRRRRLEAAYKEHMAAAHLPAPAASPPQ